MDMVKVVNTMGVKDLASGGLRSLLADMKHGDEKPIGVIHGTATGVSYRSNKFAETPAAALNGAFEGVPLDTNSPTVKSTNLFLPTNVQALLVKRVEEDIPAKDRPNKAPPIGKPVDRIGKTVTFAVEVGIRRILTDDADKYEFIVAIPKAPGESDMLDETRAQAIAMLNSRGGQRALTAPSTVTGKAKRKAK